MASTFGRYEIREQIGAGGMATVYLAHDPYFERDVALKVLPREFMHDSKFQQRFQREAKVIAGLEHSAIVPVYDYGVQDDQPFLVMRYMSGDSLKARLFESRMAFSEVLRVLDRVGGALDRAHSKGIIHRDVKPGNIMFDEDGDAYLGDFGIARLSEATSFLTGTMPIGTPAYMAPELADAGGLSHLVDIYALGIIAFMMLAGSHPYDADTPSGYVMAHLGKPVPDVRERRTDLPVSVQAVIERGMAKNPAERYQSAKDLANDLRLALEDGEVETKEAAVSSSPDSPTYIESPIDVIDMQTPNPEDAATEHMAPPNRPQVATLIEPRFAEPAPARAPEVPAVPVSPRPPQTRPRRGGIPGWLVAVGGLAMIVFGIGVVALVAISLSNGGRAAESPVAGDTVTTEEADQEDSIGGSDESSDSGDSSGGDATTAAQEATLAPSGIPVNMDSSRDSVTICMSQEPDSLYRIVSNMAVTVDVLMPTSLHGGYYDRDYWYETQALVDGEFPTFDNGGAQWTGSGSSRRLQVTYQFRDDIVWSDGVPFTVDDIIYTREVILDPNSGATTRGILSDMDFEKVDDYTLQVTYPAGVSEPTYFLPPLSSLENMTDPLPEHVLGSMRPAQIVESEYARLPNPTLGPYEVSVWREGDYIELSANRNYWGEEPLLDTITFRFISDTNQLLASVLSGECDFVTDDGLQLTQLPFIQDSADQGLIAYETIPSLVWEHIDFNTAPPSNAENNGYGLFVDARVRQAVAYGTNRTRMVEQILYGEVEPLTSYLPADHWAYNPSTANLNNYDPDRARSLLAQAGYEDRNGDGYVEAASTLGGQLSCQRGSWSVPGGTRLEANFHTTTGNALREQIVTLFQRDMADIGVEINIDLLPASVWFADDGPLFTRTYQIGEFAWVTGQDPSATFIYLGQNGYRTPSGDFQVAEVILRSNPGLNVSDREFISGRPSAGALGGYELVYPEQIPDAADNGEGGNNLGWCNTEADQAIFAADQELEAEDRLPYFLDHQMIFAQEVPSLPLFQRVQVSAFAVNLCGVELGSNNSPTWNADRWYFCES